VNSSSQADSVSGALRRCWLPALFALLVLGGCRPGPEPSSGELKLEERSDGLTYEQGATAPFTGTHLERTESGHIRQQQDYAEGRKHGVWKLFYLDGVLKHQIDYCGGEIIRDREWFSNGQLKGDEPMRNGIALGLCQFWYEDGRVRKIARVTDNLQVHGQFLELAPDGSVIADALYDRGEYVMGIRPPRGEPWKGLQQNKPPATANAGPPPAAVAN
jgi:hypothetical protein